MTYDPDAIPVDAERGVKAKLKRIRFIQNRVAALEAERKETQAALIPLLNGPRVILDPVTGAPLIASVVQSRSIVVDPGELLTALMDHYAPSIDGMRDVGGLDKAETVWHDCLKPREVDSKDGGLFHQAVERGQVPFEVVAKVAKEKVNTAFISFPKPRK